MLTKGDDHPSAEPSTSGEAGRRLRGQRILITGAGRGLGAVFARAVADAGGSVLGLGRNRDVMENLLAELPHHDGAVHEAVIADVTDREGLMSALEGRSITGVINNAGVAMSDPLHTSDEDETRNLIEVNILAALWVLQAATPSLEAGGGGVVVNIASTLGHRPLPRTGAYAASKAALIQMTRSASIELGAKNIRVNALAPGYIKTDINREFLESPAGEKLIRRTALGRIADAAELIPPLMLLLDPANSYMTGSILTVDGGMSASL